jgi:hypothetical protein
VNSGRIPAAVEWIPWPSSRVDAIHVQMYSVRDAFGQMFRYMYAELGQRRQRISIHYVRYYRTAVQQHRDGGLGRRLCCPVLQARSLLIENTVAW